jgi:hypothetical protein
MDGLFHRAIAFSISVQSAISSRLPWLSESFHLLRLL